MAHNCLDRRQCRILEDYLVSRTEAILRERPSFRALAVQINQAALPGLPVVTTHNVEAAARAVDFPWPRGRSQASESSLETRIGKLEEQVRKLAADLGVNIAA